MNKDALTAILFALLTALSFPKQAASVQWNSELIELWNASREHQPADDLLALAQTSTRSRYRKINTQEFVSSYQLSGSEPKAVALQFFQKLAGDSEEGRKSEQISIEYPSRQTAVVNVTVVGLADDSVRAIRYRLEFKRQAGSWQIVWVGSQTLCQAGRGHQNWSARSCV